MIDLQSSTKKSRKYREKLLYALAAGISATMFLELSLTQLSANAKDYLYLRPTENGKLRRLAYGFDKTLSRWPLGDSEYTLQSGFEPQIENISNFLSSEDCKTRERKEEWRSGKMAYYISGGVTQVAVKGYDWIGSYYFYRLGKNFGRVSLFGQLSRDELGKTYGIGLKLYPMKGFYLLRCQGQGMDNVDIINHKWVYTYPEELVVQHAYFGHGIGYHNYWGDWGFSAEYSRDRIECGDDRGGAWIQKADKINISVAYRWQ